MPARFIHHVQSLYHPVGELSLLRLVFANTAFTVRMCGQSGVGGGIGTQFFDGERRGCRAGEVQEERR